MNQLLYTVRNNFYVGNYTHCIELFNNVENQLDSDEKDECLYFIYRSFISLDQPKKSLNLMAMYYIANDEIKKQKIVNELETLNIAHPQDDKVKIITALIYLEKESNKEMAYKILSDGFDLECYFLGFSLLLSINRYEIAEIELNKMRKVNDYSPLTVLAKCQFYLCSNSMLHDVIGLTNDLLNKYGETLVLLNIKACAHINLLELEAAEECLLKALHIEPHNEFILRNYYTNCIRMKKSSDVIEKSFKRVIDTSDTLKDELEKASLLFDNVL